MHEEGRVRYQTKAFLCTVRVQPEIYLHPFLHQDQKVSPLRLEMGCRAVPLPSDQAPCGQPVCPQRGPP